MPKPYVLYPYIRDELDLAVRNLNLSLIDSAPEADDDILPQDLEMNLDWRDERPDIDDDVDETVAGLPPGVLDEIDDLTDDIP
jgi:hypothetical protein